MAGSFKNTPNGNSGFTLIEVLVALLVLAIGMLGIAALQFKAMRYSNDAFMRSHITFLAYDIADRIRANAANGADYLGNYTIPNNPGANACNQATGANAANDLGCWRNVVDSALPPGASANITQAGSLYTVSMGWTDREGQTHTIQYSFQ